MASITQTRARKNKLLAEGTPWTGDRVIWLTSANTPGFVEAAGTEYTVTIGEIVTSLTEDEMLSTTIKWLEMYHSRKQRAARKSDAA